MKFSMGSWAFSFGPFASHPIPLLEIAKALASAGYDGIELGGYPPHVTLETYASMGSRRELKKTLDDLGLAVSGYAADFEDFPFFACFAASTGGRIKKSQVRTRRILAILPTSRLDFLPTRSCRFASQQDFPILLYRRRFSQV